MAEVIDVGGVDVHVEGEGAETIVMLHGWPDTYRLWDAQVAALSGAYRCARFTLPGFEPGKPPRPTSLVDTVALIHRIVRTVSPDRPVILLQHDWGSIFGNQFALRHPQLVSRIVCVDVGDALSPEYAAQLGARAKAMVFSYQMWLALAWRIGGRLGDRMTRYMAGKIRCPTDPALIASQMNYPYYITWFGKYGSYRLAAPGQAQCRTLYIFGTKKPFMFHTQGWLDCLQRQQGSKVVPMKAGHWMMRTRTAEFNEEVVTWLAAGRAGKAGGLAA
jgi:cis-3-alkyl-4-acyloxetan-2-one decarboxylase